MSERSRRALYQDQHAALQASGDYSRVQLCAYCDNPTDRCEEDFINCDRCDGYPLCEDCVTRLENETVCVRCLPKDDANAS